MHVLRDHVVIPHGFNIFTQKVGESVASCWCAYEIFGTIWQPHYMFSNWRASNETNLCQYIHKNSEIKLVFTCIT